jgi:GAF domain-containing protein
MADDKLLLKTLTEFAESMADGYELTDVLYRLTDDVTKVLRIAGAGIAVADEDGQLRYATASSEQVTVLERRQEQDQLGPCVEAFSSQAIVTVEDIATRTDWSNYRKEAQRLGYRSVAGVPLSLRSERLGALNLYDREVRSWGDDELHTAKVLADMVAGYLIHDLLVDARRVGEQLQHALNSRVIIEQAKGILSSELGVTVDEAFDALRRHARNNNASLTTLAHAVVVEGFRPAD